ncbi:MazG nucleotide pyrophosphohydrolase domain-containing protein [Arthrobacter bambusae]|uniref:MazG nucleotide pyrophosphohydrolase domain-containing protein n=1 Tax=Arthrobacter bambusae TaxID=1338426 RepID=UPI0027894051|nr:MazG nucleotide pyrophosphohydrolase domain-containing protein [Arthrobacter bambusae]MDQ0209969.1 XTP/dITP diphosphohydrolase [Arthrobacter bambusae]MDQ0235091.1 XTP/dITP diphosphohydrolase [Arthrobacter bambusae]
MGALTHESLVEYLIEEAYEVVDSIEAGAAGTDTADELRGELGDVLLQVVLHARLAEERGQFTFDDVARTITEKMVRRNPHVFRPDGSLQDSFPATVEEIVEKWDAVKKAEKPGRSDPFEGIPPHLPALALAQKSLDRAERAERAERSGGPELRGRPVAAAEVPDSEAALGDLLLAVVAGSREKGFDAERALRAAVRRYQGREGDATKREGSDAVP